MNDSSPPGSGRWRSWLRLARIGNLPTVWSNAALGVGLAAAKTESEVDLWRTWWPAALGLSLIYAGGMVMNDAVDAGEDRQERPERPIPAGVVSVTAAKAGSVVLLTAGAIVLVVPVVVKSSPDQILLALSALALVTCVTAYNLLHHHSQLGRFSWPLMGLCRGLAVFTATASVSQMSIAPSDDVFVSAVSAATLVALYTLGITALARRESGVQAPRIRRYVLALLIGMPLLDAALLMGFRAPIQFWVFSLVCIPLTLIMQSVARGV